MYSSALLLLLHIDHMKTRHYSWLLLFSFLFVLGAVSSCGRDKTSVTTQEASILFTDTVIDYGTLHVGDGKVTHTFVFQNTGLEPLLVQKVETSCHCTLSSFSKEPLLSGEMGEVKVTFDADDTNVGTFTKTIYVYTNTHEGLNRLTIQGNLVP